MKSDAQIQQDVLRELRWDPRVEETDVGVEVDRGVVTLTGTVGSSARRLAAQEAAHRVGGVLDVANDVHVQLPLSAERTDTDVAQAVRRALEWDALVPHERLRATVADGWVTLEGEVEHWYQRDDAERAVRRLAGVRGVTDRITVHPPAVDSEEVRDAIEGALERRAEREAKRIQVAVHEGTVTLTGTVPSWPARQAVVGAARFTPGVKEVEDRLRVVLND
jgi:osmotically-inducible protein OsmY